MGSANSEYNVKVYMKYDFEYGFALKFATIRLPK